MKYYVGNGVRDAYPRRRAVISVLGDPPKGSHLVCHHPTFDSMEFLVYHYNEDKKEHIAYFERIKEKMRTGNRNIQFEEAFNVV